MDHQRAACGFDREEIGHRALPGVFCWTKMGAEAGQTLDVILRRKELERLAGDGVFAWGIGSSLGDGVNEARRLAGRQGIDVLFSPMKTRPREIDAAPEQLWLWTSYIDGRTGAEFELPSHVLVTSRGGAGKRGHYALLCRSQTIRDAALGFVDANRARNLRSNRPIGASQVTSVVRYLDDSEANPNFYRIAHRATLWGPGFVKLAAAALLTDDLAEQYHSVAQSHAPDEWWERVHALRAAAQELIRPHTAAQQCLFVPG